MRPAALAFTAIGFLISAAAAAWVASYAVHHIEATSTRVTKNALVAAGQTWAEVQADGTWVQLSGTAPEESDRIQALSVVSAVVSAGRIVDQTDVAESVPAVAPAFAMEILRSDKDISLIGITPADGETDIIRDTIAGMDVDLIDMKETTGWDAPDGWTQALEFGVSIMAQLDRAKISIAPGKVGLIAVVASEDIRNELIETLTNDKPDGVDLTIDITAPRPIFSPYTMLFIGGENPTLRCHALTSEGAMKIVEAAQSAGLARTAQCNIGLGAPTDNWADVIVTGIEAVAEMGGGRLEIRDSNIVFTAPTDFDQDRFDEIVATLRTNLPPAYVLIPSRPVTEAVVSTDRPWFTAKRPSTGLVELSGMVIDEISQQTVATFAESRFGFEQIDDKTDIAEFAPHGWTSRQLAAVNVLALLDMGEVTFTEDTVTVTGQSTLADVTDAVQDRLEAGFGADARFSVNVEQLEPVFAEISNPDANLCEEEIGLLLEAQQILFAPSSAVIESESEPIIDEISLILNRCRHAAFEIGGHTDSQGREEMNLNLSQNRANAVLDALLAEGRLLGDVTAVGYGETVPIAPNDTEEGRAKNRRIEFKLVIEDTPEPVAEPESATAETQSPSDSEATMATEMDTTTDPTPARVEPTMDDIPVAPGTAPVLRPDDFNKGVTDGTD